ncbi:ferritin-like domain-containing protein [Streptomyces sp. NPDC000410]|uniref:ferritin-like domain-containing protein n=1 Tax=Streptomyces sp. NPDC000410 TaxID=3154254 RepID=UPI003323C127
MSVFDTPRLHFRGTAVTRPPTGPGVSTGNGHFWIDAHVVAVQGAYADGVMAGGVDVADPVVGRAVDLWGHYNPYLGTTVNRARVFDLDPASRWTTTLMAGQFCFGRAGRSHDTGYMLVADMDGFLPPRWHHLAQGRTLYQFALRADDGLDWLAEADVSPAVTRLRETAAREGGLVVQFALDRQGVRGTIAPWRPAVEPRTHPAGRLLVPQGPPGDGPRALTVRVTPDEVTFNLLAALPALAGTDGARGLELRTAHSDSLVAELPAHAYASEEAALTCGIVTVPTGGGLPKAEDEPLLLAAAGAGGPVLLGERETVVVADDACVVLEHPDRERGHDHAVDIAVRSYLRGRPAAMEAVHVRQFPNPHAPGRGDGRVVDLRRGRAAGPARDYGPECVLSTDEEGRGSFTLRGAREGAARILLTAGSDGLPDALSDGVADALPSDLRSDGLPSGSPPGPDARGSAAAAYDNDDLLGYWAGAGPVSVRVLPDDWHLAAIRPQDVTFDLIHREVFAPYEEANSFMRDEVFSLADRCKVETYARLIWQMCDPSNKDKTYYMPPTRDLTEPKARLLLTFLRAQNATAPVPLAMPSAARSHPEITTRAQLRAALWQAVGIELASALQYLYAGYSLPVHGAGFEYVRRGLWTPRQLRLACGDGGETLDTGIRGSLFDVAREEMTHFLVVNNILMAMGEPFHVPALDFASPGGPVPGPLPMPLDFALEPLHLGSLHRFIALERPERLVGGSGREPGAAAVSYGSPSELYASIREGLRRVPDLFLVERGRGGGEHHLFLRESVNAVHPDYQLEVDDLSGALFAIDFVTEQGEGGVLDSVKPAGESHHDTFLRVRDLMMTERTDGSHGQGAPWNPAYPVLRNPTLRVGGPGAAAVGDPHARDVMRLFNRSYFMMLQLMVQHFGESPDASLRRSPLMNAAIDVMTGMMRPLAELLVTLPSGWRGRTAGPSFELEEPPVHLARPDVARRAFAMRFRHLAAMARDADGVPERVAELMAFYADRFGGTE